MTAPPLRLIVGGEQACSYLPDQRARSVFVVPPEQVTAPIFHQLLQRGFRRSGQYAYRPACEVCTACVPVRIHAPSFLPSRRHRRCLQRNSDLQFSEGRELREEHFALYQRYLRARHPQGGMDPDDFQSFQQFLGPTWGITEYWDARLDDRLVLTAVVDRVADGYSAVYTFFDPDEASRSLGTWAVLQQVLAAQAAHKPFVYLGYWIQGSQTMAYKGDFPSLEAYQSERWVSKP